MKTFGPFYADTMKYPPKYKWLPLVEVGWTNETEEPYRKGRCLVLKPPLANTALVAGVWGQPQDEETALSNAVRARTMDIDPKEMLEW